MAVRKVEDSVVNSFTHYTNHATIVASVLTGGVVSLAILVVNVLACALVLGRDFEFTGHVDETSINLYIVFSTLAINILFSLPLLLCVFYIMICFNGRNIFKRLCCKRALACSVSPCLSHCVKLSVGSYTFEKIESLSKSSIISVMFPLMMLTPVLCLSSHVGYILLAWLTEPEKCTVVFLLYYVGLLFFFFTFRKCYKVHSKIKFSLKGLSKQRKKVGNGGKERDTSGIELAIVGSERNDAKSSVDFGEIEPEIKSKRCCVFEFHSNPDKEHINTQAFCLLVFYGFIIAGFAAMVALFIRFLPFESAELVTYMFQLLQLIVVLVSAQIGYQLLFGNGFSLESVFKKFKEVYAERGGQEKLVAIAEKKHEELSNVVGEFAAELTDVVIHAPKQK